MSEDQEKFMASVFGLGIKRGSISMTEDQQKIMDLLEKVSQDVARLQRERDEARAEVERYRISKFYTRCREGSVDHAPNCATWGDDGQGNLNGETVSIPCNCGAAWNWAKRMESERDAARAERDEAQKEQDEARAAKIDSEKVSLLTELDSMRRGWSDCEARLQATRKERDEAQKERNEAKAEAARAVEALESFARAYRVSMLPFAPGIDEQDGTYHWMPHGWPSVAEFKQANAVFSATQPALDWLAAQRREAAEVERIANTNVIRSLGPRFCDFVFGNLGEAEYLAGVLDRVRREAAAAALEGLKVAIRGGVYRPHVPWREISTRTALLRAGEVTE